MAASDWPQTQREKSLRLVSLFEHEIAHREVQRRFLSSQISQLQRQPLSRASTPPPRNATPPQRASWPGSPGVWSPPPRTSTPPPRGRHSNASWPGSPDVRTTPRRTLAPPRGQEFDARSLALCLPGSKVSGQPLRRAGPSLGLFSVFVMICTTVVSVGWLTSGDPFDQLLARGSPSFSNIDVDVDFMTMHHSGRGAEELAGGEESLWHHSTAHALYAFQTGLRTNLDHSSSTRNVDEYLLSQQEPQAFLFAEASPALYVQDANRHLQGESAGATEQRKDPLKSSHSYSVPYHTPGRTLDADQINEAQVQSTGWQDPSYLGIVKQERSIDVNADGLQVDDSNDAWLQTVDSSNQGDMPVLGLLHLELPVTPPPAQEEPISWQCSLASLFEFIAVGGLALALLWWLLPSKQLAYERYADAKPDPQISIAKADICAAPVMVEEDRSAELQVAPMHRRRWKEGLLTNRAKGAVGESGVGPPAKAEVPRASMKPRRCRVSTPEPPQIYKPIMMYLAAVDDQEATPYPFKSTRLRERAACEAARYVSSAADAEETAREEQVGRVRFAGA